MFTHKNKTKIVFCMSDLGFFENFKDYNFSFFRISTKFWKYQLICNIIFDVIYLFIKKL